MTARRASMAQRRRSVRFASALALAALTAAAALPFERTGVMLGLISLAGLLALWAVLRYPRPGGASGDLASRLNAAARLVVLAGLALALAAFGVSRWGAERAGIAALCPGQSAQMGRWNLALGQITPVAGEGFTALQAEIAARSGNRPAIKLSPQLRAYFGPAAGSDSAVRAHLWGGDLAVRLAAYDPRKGCLTLEASWLPLLGWMRIGCWLAALGAAVMALAAFASIWWRSAARTRIAMRREDRPLPAGAAKPAPKRRDWRLAALSAGSFGTNSLTSAASSEPNACEFLALNHLNIVISG